VFGDKENFSFDEDEETANVLGRRLTHGDVRYSSSNMRQSLVSKSIRDMMKTGSVIGAPLQRRGAAPDSLMEYSYEVNPLWRQHDFASTPVMCRNHVDRSALRVFHRCECGLDTLHGVVPCVQAGLCALLYCIAECEVSCGLCAMFCMHRVVQCAILCYTILCFAQHHCCDCCECVLCESTAYKR